MADFTREELADFRAKIMSGSPDQALEVSPEAILRLLSMAERAVSEDAVRFLGEFYAERSKGTALVLQRWNDFAFNAELDLRPAAALRSARAEAFEEAAKLCNARAQQVRDGAGYFEDEELVAAGFDGARALDDAAAAIRAAKDQETR